MKNVKRRDLIIIALVLVASVIASIIEAVIEPRIQTTQRLLDEYGTDLMDSQGCMTLYAYNGDEVFVRVDNRPNIEYRVTGLEDMVVYLNNYRDFKDYIEKYTERKYQRYLKDLYPRRFFWNHTLIIANIDAAYVGWQYGISLDSDQPSLLNPLRKGNEIRLIESGLAPDRLHEEAGAHEMIFVEVPNSVNRLKGDVVIDFYSSNPSRGSPFVEAFLE